MSMNLRQIRDIISRLYTFYTSFIHKSKSISHPYEIQYKRNNVEKLSGGGINTLSSSFVCQHDGNVK